MSEEKAYQHWLYQAAGIGRRAFLRELGAAGTAKEIYEQFRTGELLQRMEERKKNPEKVREYLGEMEEFSKSYEVEKEYEKLRCRAISLVTKEEEGYPERLRTIPDAPWALYYAGRLPVEGRSVAVIGARDCTEYGRHMAKEFGAYLAENGVQIISGMARGIDGISQEAALWKDGYSLGVLGCGVDVCYPECNRPLYEKLLEKGGICSEYPPGTAPRAMLFPPRNRIISGLADAVLVIEAREKSGTLITVDMALEQGRDVYALPGRTTDPLSLGCLRLIRQGAGLVCTPQQLLDELQGGTKCMRLCEQQELVFLEESLEKLYRLLDYEPQSASVLILRYQAAYQENISLPELLDGLLRLCVLGYVVQTAGTYFTKKG